MRKQMNGNRANDSRLDSIIETAVSLMRGGPWGSRRVVFATEREAVAHAILALQIEAHRVPDVSARAVERLVRQRMAETVKTVKVNVRRSGGEIVRPAIKAVKITGGEIVQRKIEVVT